MSIDFKFNTILTSTLFSNIKIISESVLIQVEKRNFFRLFVEIFYKIFLSVGNRVRKGKCKESI